MTAFLFVTSGQTFSGGAASGTIVGPAGFEKGDNGSEITGTVTDSGAWSKTLARPVSSS